MCGHLAVERRVPGEVQGRGEVPRLAQDDTAGDRVPECWRQVPWEVGTRPFGTDQRRRCVPKALITSLSEDHPLPCPSL